jgi:hypothetical protein
MSAESVQPKLSSTPYWTWQASSEALTVEAKRKTAIMIFIVHLDRLLFFHDCSPAEKDAIFGMSIRPT